MKSRQASAAATSTCAVAPASRAPCTASPGRSKDFEGMHAQYEHSPPTSSRSTTATRRPPSASAPAQCSAPPTVPGRRGATDVRCGRVTKEAVGMDVATLADLLHETALHHDTFEKS